MEGIENIEKGGVSLVKLVVLGDKAMENGKIGPEDFGLLIDLGGLIPGLMALKKSGKELLDVDDAEQVKLTASFEAAAGDGKYAGIGADVLAWVVAGGNVVEGVRAAKAAKAAENTTNAGSIPFAPQ
jgi:hypothetical protein